MLPHSSCFTHTRTQFSPKNEQAKESLFHKLYHKHLPLKTNTPKPPRISITLTEGLYFYFTKVYKKQDL